VAAAVADIHRLPVALAVAGKEALMELLLLEHQTLVAVEAALAHLVRQVAQAVQAL
jgi:hypothetical protein